MLKSIIFSLIAACSGASNPNPNPDHPDEIRPAPEEDQHFCCDKVGGFEGDGCVAVGKEHINTCLEVLYCAGTWEKSEGGHVKCHV